MLPSRISKRRGARPTQLNCTQAVRTHACHIVVPTRELVRAWSSARPCQRPPARDTPVARAARGHEHVRSCNQARSVCFNARGCDGCFEARVIVAHLICCSQRGALPCVRYAPRIRAGSGCIAAPFCGRTCGDMHLARAMALCKSVRSANISIKSLRECETCCCNRLNKFDFKLQ